MSLVLLVIAIVFFVLASLAAFGVIAGVVAGGFAFLGLAFFAGSFIP